MRINIYTEEMDFDGDADIVIAEYISSRTGKPMTNYGLRVFVKSYEGLHFVPPRDDDHSAVTFWCGADRANCIRFLERVMESIK